jgi:hypothetical protein
LLNHAPQSLTAELRSFLADGTLNIGDRLWAPQTWGSWFEYAVPQLRVAVDSRIELFPPAVWAEAARVAAAEGDWQAILDRYVVEAVVVSLDESALIAALDDSPAWRRIDDLRDVAGREGWLFIRVE